MRISDWSSDVCSSDLDKAAWSQSFQELIELRQRGTIGQVIDFMRAQSHMRVPEAVVDREDRLAAVGADPVEDEPRRVTQLRKLREVPYAELIAVDAFIDGHTPFATKHGDRTSTRLNSSH